MPARLSVNLNAVAMLRNRRDLPWPSVAHLGEIALAAGAHGLTVHPRPDERHIRFSDLSVLRALIDDRYPEAEFNIEGFPSEAFMALVGKIQPDQVTLVPDDPAQATSDHGWDFGRDHKFLKPVVARLKKDRMRVSLFADADASAETIAFARQTGADRLEFYTGPYGATHDDPAKAESALEDLAGTADKARDAGLGFNAGHDLTLANLPPLVERLPDLAEVSIGHGLTADALELGMAETVRRYLRAAGNDA